MKRVLVVAFAVMLMGHKCDKPKAPGAEAIDAVEQAWWSAEMAPLAPDEVIEVTLEVEGGEPVTVVFTRPTSETVATVEVDGESFTFVIDEQGEAHTAQPAARP